MKERFSSEIIVYICHSRSVEEYNKLDESLERELIANTEQWNRAKEEKRSFEIYTKTIMALEQKFQRQNLKELSEFNERK